MLGNQDWMMTAACSAGPAYIGGRHPLWGMRAEDGASDKAIQIGLLPDIERQKFTYRGNSSIVGAYMALLSNQYRREAQAICRNMT